MASACVDFHSQRKYHLGRCDSYFGASIDVDTAVSLSGYSRSNSINDSNTKGTTLQAISQRQNRVRSLPALTQEDANIVSENRRLTIKEIGGKLDADRNLRQLFENCTRGYARVVTRSTRAKYDPTSTSHDRKVRPQTAQFNLVRLKVDTPTHSIDDGLRLLVNLLFHDGRDLEFQSLDTASGSDLARCFASFLGTQPVDVQSAPRNMRNVIILEVDDAFG